MIDLRIDQIEPPLSTRAYRRLLEALRPGMGWTDGGDPVMISEVLALRANPRALLRVKNCGPKTVTEIDQFCREHGNGIEPAMRVSSGTAKHRQRYEYKTAIVEHDWELNKLAAEGWRVVCAASYGIDLADATEGGNGCMWVGQYLMEREC